MSRWVVVSDSVTAQIFADEGGELRLVDELVHEPSRDHSRHLMGNRPNENQHFMEKDLKGDEASSLRDDESVRFAKDTAEHLRVAHAQNKFDELVLIADPRTLGRLRQELSPAVEKAVTMTRAKRALDMEREQLQELLEP